MELSYFVTDIVSDDLLAHPPNFHDFSHLALLCPPPGFDERTPEEPVELHAGLRKEVSRPSLPLLEHRWQWEVSLCPLCSGGQSTTVIQAPDPLGPLSQRFTVVKCLQCSLCYTNPRPTSASMEWFYPPTYPPHNTMRNGLTESAKQVGHNVSTSWRESVEKPSRPRPKTGSSDLDPTTVPPANLTLMPETVSCAECGVRNPGQNASLWHRVVRGGIFPQRFSAFRKALPWHGQGRLLDVGCGNGSFLQRMARQGWRVTGIDACERVVQRLRVQFSLPVFAGTLPHPELPPGSFDVITMWQSLEHMHAPLSALREARRLLAPGGKLLVTVPNLASWPFAWFGPSWIGLDLPRHLTHFTPHTLTLMLQRAGFQVGSVQMRRSSSWMRVSASRNWTSPTKRFWHRWLTWKFPSSVASWLCALVGRADSMMVIAT